MAFVILIISAFSSISCTLTKDAPFWIPITVVASVAIVLSVTGYPKFSFVDLTDSIEEYIDIWQELRANFDTIYSGFLGSSNPPL